jgi:hypothetical protein
VAVGADKQEVPLILFQEPDNPLVRVARYELKVGLDRIGLEVGAGLGQGFFTQLQVARDCDNDERNFQ